MTVMGGQAGILQGERRWFPLAHGVRRARACRASSSARAASWQPDRASAMLGVVLGLFAPVVVGWWALRHGPRPRGPATTTAAGRIQGDHPQLQALLAFFVLSNADIVVARNVLADHDAGLYAGGLILTKAVLFLPQFVVVWRSRRWRPRATGERRRAHPQPRRRGGRRAGLHPRLPGALRRRAGLRRRHAVRPDPVPAVGVRGPRHVPRDAAAARLLRGGPPGPRSTYLDLGPRSSCWWPANFQDQRRDARPAGHRHRGRRRCCSRCCSSVRPAARGGPPRRGRGPRRPSPRGGPAALVRGLVPAVTGADRDVVPSTGRDYVLLS